MRGYFKLMHDVSTDELSFGNLGESGLLSSLHDALMDRSRVHELIAHDVLACRQFCNYP